MTDPASTRHVRLVADRYIDEQQARLGPIARSEAGNVRNLSVVSRCKPIPGAIRKALIENPTMIHHAIANQFGGRHSQMKGYCGRLIAEGAYSVCRHHTQKNGRPAPHGWAKAAELEAKIAALQAENDELRAQLATATARCDRDHHHHEQRG